MTVSARTVETSAADALARQASAETEAAEAFGQLLNYTGDTDNAAFWLSQFERSFSSPIIRVETLYKAYYSHPRVVVVFEDGSVLHLTVTQVKEANQ